MGGVYWTEYEYIPKVKFSIFVFEYPVFGDKYSNIRIYLYIRPLQNTIFDRIEYEYIWSKFSNIRIWISINRRQIFKYSNISEYIRIFALHCHALSHCYWLYFLASNPWKSIYWSLTHCTPHGVTSSSNYSENVLSWHL